MTPRIIFFLIFLSGCASLDPYAAYKQARAESKAEMLRKHPEWPQKTRLAIENNEIYIGMTKDQLLASWGLPNDINRNVYPKMVREQWVYGPPFHDYEAYVYVDNDIVTSYSD